jgi:hypothetical protein
MNFMKHMLDKNCFSIFVHTKDIYQNNKGFHGTLPTNLYLQIKARVCLGFNMQSHDAYVNFNVLYFECFGTPFPWIIHLTMVISVILCN